jgi:threonine dehydrogenase-like Zn-dependent dehydrogenase
LKLGAHIALDPNKEGDRLVQKIRDLCRSRGERSWSGGGKTGPDHVIEAVGGDLIPPKVEMGPDPTGLLSLNQAWDLCSQIGTVVTTSVGHPEEAKVSFPASQWADGAKHHLPGTMGGMNLKRDSIRFTRLIETGQFDMKSLLGSTFPLERIKEAFKAVGERTVIAAVITFR